MEKHFTQWTRKEFETLPRPNSFVNDIGEVDSLVILPTRYRHDSGYRCMEFATIQGSKPTYIISGCSDVIHLGGTSGCDVYGFDCKTFSQRVKERKVPIVCWRIDCLPVSGLLHLFCDYKLYVGASVSSFEIFTKIE